MNKVLMISYGVLGRENGYRSRVIAELRQLRRHQVDVELLHFERMSREQAAALRSELHDLGVSLTLCPRLKDLHSLLLPLDLLRAALLAPVMRRKGYTVLHCQGFAAAPVGLVLQALVRRPLVVDIHGIYSEEVRLRGGAGVGLFRWIEQRAVRTAAGLIGVSRRILDYFGPEAGEKGVVLPCCVDISRFRWDPVVRQRIRQQLNLDGKIVMVYAGTLLPWQEGDGMMQLFQAVRAVDPAVHLLVVTPQLAEFRAAAVRNGVPEADLTLVSARHDQVSDYLNAGDCGLLLRSPNVVNQTASPTKFAEYLAAGLPVVLSPDIGDSEPIIRTQKAGYVLKPGDVTGLYAYLVEVCKARALFAERCRQVAIEHFDWSHHDAALLRQYQFVTTGGRQADGRPVA